MVVKPSEALTKDCEQPLIKGNTNRDVYVLAIEQNKSIEECTDRMRALRK